MTAMKNTTVEEVKTAVTEVADMSVTNRTAFIGAVMLALPGRSPAFYMGVVMGYLLRANEEPRAL